MLTKLQMFKRTYEFFKQLGNSDNCTFGKIAQVSGKEMQTAEAWGRPPESDEFPFGTGKRNPFDMVIRLLGMAYDISPGFARKWARIFLDYIDYRDALSGKEHKQNGGSTLELYSKTAKEASDVLCALTRQNADLQEIWTQYEEYESAMQQFGACLKEQMKETQASKCNGSFANSKAPQEVSRFN